MYRKRDVGILDANARRGLAAILTSPRFEVLPTPGVEELVFQSLTPGTVVHVMCPPELGANHSVDVALKIGKRGYEAVPHLAARTVLSGQHLQELLGKLHEGGIRSAFFPGGDGNPVGQYTSAVELLDDLGKTEHGLNDIGIAAYPQGHRAIPDPVLLQALLQKQHVATYMVTENCFDPAAIVSWLAEVRRAGITLPLMVGVPGIVPLRRLLAACKQFGLPAAARYLRNQHGMLRAIVGAKFSPLDVVLAMASSSNDPSLKIVSIHFFTFNEVAATERWRREVLNQNA